MPNYSHVHLNLQSPNEESEGHDYIECWKFTIPKNEYIIGTSTEKSGTWEKRWGKGEITTIIDIYIKLFTT